MNPASGVLNLCGRQCQTSPCQQCPPCRQCPHVVVVIELVCVNDPWGYPVVQLMPDRSKVTPEEDPTSLRQAKLESATREGLKKKSRLLLQLPLVPGPRYLV